jgi:hypothetical protein
MATVTTATAATTAAATATTAATTTTAAAAGYDLIIDQDLKPWLLEVNASPSLSANTKEDYLMKCEMLNGMLDVVDMEEVLTGSEEHVSGWDLVYDNGFIEIDPSQCSYTTFLGAGVPEAEEEDEEDGDGEEEGGGAQGQVQARRAAAGGGHAK